MLLKRLGDLALPELAGNIQRRLVRLIAQARVGTFGQQRNGRLDAIMLGDSEKLNKWSKVYCRVRRT